MISGSFGLMALEIGMVVRLSVSCVRQRYAVRMGSGKNRKGEDSIALYPSLTCHNGHDSDYDMTETRLYGDVQAITKVL